MQADGGGRRVSGRRLRREEIFYSKHCWEQTSLAFQVRILKGIERPEKRAPGFYRFDRGWNPTRTVINHYKDPYQTTSIVESKRAFLVAHFLLDNGGFLDLLILGIQPKSGFWLFQKGHYQNKILEKFTAQKKIQWFYPKLNSYSYVFIYSYRCFFGFWCWVRWQHLVQTVGGLTCLTLPAFLG